MQPIEQKLKAERRSGHTQLRMPRRRLKYHPQWLSLADDYYELTKQFIINPRNLHATSLKEADVPWMNDCITWQQMKRYLGDSDKREKLAGADFNRDSEPQKAT